MSKISFGAMYFKLKNEDRERTLPEALDIDIEDIEEALDGVAPDLFEVCEPDVRMQNDKNSPLGNVRTTNCLFFDDNKGLQYLEEIKESGMKPHTDFVYKTLPLEDIKGWCDLKDHDIQMKKLLNGYYVARALATESPSKKALQKVLRLEKRINDAQIRITPVISQAFLSIEKNNRYEWMG